MNCRVERPVIYETTALGAAYLAGLGVGYWQDQQEIAAKWQSDKIWHPLMTDEQREQLYSGWRRAVQAAMAFV